MRECRGFASLSGFPVGINTKRRGRGRMNQTMKERLAISIELLKEQDGSPEMWWVVGELEDIFQSFDA